MFSNYDPQNLECAYPVIKETIPASKLGYSTNNIYQGYPPLMNDGRSIIASFQPQGETNNKILRDNNIESNWQYRQYLQNNAKAIMEENFREASNDIGYIQRYSNEQPPKKTSTNRYEYNDKSDLKDIYLSREELNNRIGYSFK
jgi:hypothetical protein